MLGDAIYETLLERLLAGLERRPHQGVAAETYQVELLVHGVDTHGLMDRYGANCRACDTRFIPNRGNIRYCSGPCRQRAGNARVRNWDYKKIACAECGNPMWFSRLPEGAAACRPCRRARQARAVQARSPRPPKATKSRGTTTERGYGQDHQKARKWFLSQFVPGDPCARCGDPMREDQKLDLDHTDDRSGYLGLSHASCNRSHGKAGPGRRRYPWTNCPICGAGKRKDTATCGRTCGRKWRAERYGISPAL